MKWNKEEFGQRLWGFSIGAFLSLIGTDRPLWLALPIALMFAYFITFGADHFKNKIEK